MGEWREGEGRWALIHKGPAQRSAMPGGVCGHGQPSPRDSFKVNHHSMRVCMSNIMLELGQLDKAKLPVTEFEQKLIARCEKRKLAMLRLANWRMSRIPMGGKHLGGCWVKPVAVN